MDNQDQQKVDPGKSDTRISRLSEDSISRVSNIPQAANLDGIQTRFSPLRFLIITIGGIFLSEIVAMIFLTKFSTLPYYLQTLLDATINVIMIFPLIYYFSLQPLITHIEKRKQAEDELRKSEERFVKAFHFSPAALSITRAVDGGFIDVNESFLHLYGSNRQDVIGRTSIELGMFINPDERDELKQQTFKEKLFAQEGVRDYEMEARVWSGENRTVLISTEGIELAGEPCILTSISDITERKQADAAIRRLSSIIEQTDDTVVVTDRNGVIEYVNPSFERLTGYTREEAIGQTPKLLKSGRHDNHFYKGLWNTILDASVFQAEIVNRKKNGELYYEVKTITPLRDVDAGQSHLKDGKKVIFAEEDNLEDDTNQRD
jgi:PAS domain S-box-containing protein